MKRLPFFFAFFFILNCTAIVFDQTTAKKCQETFENLLQKLKGQASKQGRLAVVKALEKLEAERLEDLENNKRAVNLARVLLINYVLQRNVSSLQQHFTMTKRDIQQWVNAQMSNYTAAEIWAANIVLQARMKDFLASLSSSLRWGQII